MSTCSGIIRDLVFAPRRVGAPHDVRDRRDRHRHIATLARGKLPPVPAFVKVQDDDGGGCVLFRHSIQEHSRTDVEESHQLRKVCVIVGESHIQGIVEAWNKEMKQDRL